MTLKLDEKKSSDFLEENPDCLCIVDKKGMVLDCNSKTLDLLGYSKNEIIGKSCFDFVAEQDRAIALNRFEEMARRGIGIGTAILIKKRNGTTFHGICKGIKTKDKRTTYLISIKDTTELHDKIHNLADENEMIKSRLQQLAKRSMLTDELIATIAHDLKSSLAIIRGYVDILLAGHMGSLNEDQTERMKIVNSTSEMMMKLAVDLLDLQKLELEKLKMDMQSQSISDTINESILKFEPNAIARGIEITSKIQKDLVCIFDKIRIEQVMMNLLSNAIIHCSKDRGRIDVTLNQEGSMIRISISDNGTGIEEKNLSRVFSKFYQIQNPAENTRGTGLGLSICEGIVKKHGGRIWAESAGLGKGTTFNFLLPLNQY